MSWDKPVGGTSCRKCLTFLRTHTLIWSLLFQWWKEAGCKLKKAHIFDSVSLVPSSFPKEQRRQIFLQAGGASGLPGHTAAQERSTWKGTPHSVLLEGCRVCNLFSVLWPAVNLVLTHCSVSCSRRESCAASGCNSVIQILAVYPKGEKKKQRFM